MCSQQLLQSITKIIRENYLNDIKEAFSQNDKNTQDWTKLLTFQAKSVFLHLCI